MIDDLDLGFDEPDRGEGQAPARRGAPTPGQVRRQPGRPFSPSRSRWSCSAASAAVRSTASTGSRTTSSHPTTTAPAPAR
ncbi:hypothetical protein V2I01_29065 [Micromonospora sp. BRA006-A]|nr:hypothetical protein [Micromonospora sp. BRA006-A]